VTKPKRKAAAAEEVNLQPGRVYSEKLFALIDEANALPDVEQTRAVKAIVYELDGEGVVGDMIHTLPGQTLERVVELIRFQRETGPLPEYAAIHARARSRFTS
jgi:hypothetical protein